MRAGCWLISALGTLVLLAAVVLPRVAGAQPYVVLTGSMTPTYPPGTLVVVRPTEPAAVRVGDVITFQLRSGEPTVVTHRVVSVGADSTGSLTFTTRGDANPAPDVDPVRPVQVRGTVWYAVPWVGHLAVLLTPADHRRAELLLGLTLLLYAAGVVVGAWSRRGARQVAADPAPERPAEVAA